MSTYTAPDTPKSLTFTWKDIGGGKVTVQVTAVRVDGHIEQQLVTVGPTGADGASPISGTEDSDSETVVSPDPTTSVETTFKKGRQVGTATYRFSQDGRRVSVDFENSGHLLRMVLNKK
jgi:hypothetical protein